ncbi:hypothetical protein BLOT_005387 [Blomia tropicalis]|nr:hypothetical protein BLOT_005387 [Blomia tropicalis]
MSILSVILLTTVAAIVVYMPRTEAQYGGIFGGGSPGNSMMNGFNGLNSKIQFFLNGYKSLKQAKLKATTVRSTDAGMTCSDGSYRDMIPGSFCTFNMDCQQRYSYSECNYLSGVQKTCFCRCGYRWDINTQQCISSTCWYCSSGAILAIVIVILVIVVIVAFFTIPTCALISCYGANKQ